MNPTSNLMTELEAKNDQLFGRLMNATNGDEIQRVMKLIEFVETLIEALWEDANPEIAEAMRLV